MGLPSIWPWITWCNGPTRLRAVPRCWRTTIRGSSPVVSMRISHYLRDHHSQRRSRDDHRGPYLLTCFGVPSGRLVVETSPGLPLKGFDRVPHIGPGIALASSIAVAGGKTNSPIPMMTAAPTAPTPEITTSIGRTNGPHHGKVSTPGLSPNGSTRFMGAFLT